MTIVSVLYIALGLYLVSAVCYVVSLVAARKGLEKPAHYFFALAFAVHLFAFVLRYIVNGYVPITNLHESLSFFALCTAGFFIFLRRIYRVGVLGSIFLPALCLMLIGALSARVDIRPLPPV